MRQRGTLPLEVEYLAFLSRPLFMCALNVSSRLSRRILKTVRCGTAADALIQRPLAAVSSM